MTFPIRIDEQDRIESLQNLNILDTACNEAVDRFVRIGQSLFDVPVAAATLMDIDRQWLYGVRGLEVQETCRDIAFCNYTIFHEKVIETCDASADPRFCDNPLVTGEPYVRYYIGAPIFYDDKPLGALCMLDTTTREPASEKNRTILVELASAISREIGISLRLEQTTGEMAAMMMASDAA